MINIQEKVALAPLTSFRLGGEAKFYVEVSNIDELKEALIFAKEKNFGFYVLGGGTNVLVSDEGFSGLVVRLKMNKVDVVNNTIIVDCGVPLIKAINFSATGGLSGIESLAGIPGTVGGAVRGNAGAFGSEIGSSVRIVSVLDSETMEILEFSKEQCEFAYRQSVFKKRKNLIVLSVQLELSSGEQEDILQKIKDTIAKRTSRGLHGIKSAGSYFMNPMVENENLCAEFEKESGMPPRNKTIPAGWIIDRVGLRGKQIGGAQISEQHANYIINTGAATAEDVIMLVSFAKQQVRDKLGIQLTEEVNYVGF